MRHFLPPRPVTTLALDMGQAAPTAVLIPRPRGASGLPSRRRGTALMAVTTAPVAAATDHHLTATAAAVEQAGRIEHRQLLPMSPGWPPTSGRYLPTARAWHAPGCGTGEDCGGRYQCRTCLNGTDPLDHPPALVILWAPRTASPASPFASLSPPTSNGYSPLSLAMARAIRQLSAGFRSRRHWSIAPVAHAPTRSPGAAPNRR